VGGGRGGGGGGGGGGGEESGWKEWDKERAGERCRQLLVAAVNDVPSSVMTLNTMSGKLPPRGTHIPTLSQAGGLPQYGEIQYNRKWVILAEM